jgi:hypothetical protein
MLGCYYAFRARGWRLAVHQYVAMLARMQHDMFERKLGIQS